LKRVKRVQTQRNAQP